MELNRLVSTNRLSHEEWLAYRKMGIGGSDAGTICGLNQYRSPISVYLDKTAGNVEEQEDNEAMRQGRDLEQYVAERFSEETGKKVRKANAIFYLPEAPYMIANVDRLVVGENAGLECKTASAYSAEKWQGEKIPPEYEIQCHHYMAVTGASAWYIACVILGREFIWRKIDRDPDVIEMLKQIEEEFWIENVQKGKMPDPDGSDAADNAIREKYPESDEKSILLTGFDADLERRRDILELQDKLEREKKEIEQKIKLYMEDAEKAESDHYAVCEWHNKNTHFFRRKFPTSLCLKASYRYTESVTKILRLRRDNNYAGGRYENNDSNVIQERV